MRDARPIRRILMTTDAVGGVWTHALDLTRGLTARGVRVDLAVLGPAPRPHQREEARSAGVQLLERPGRLEWMTDPWLDVEKNGAWLLDLDRRHRPDVIHLNGYCHGALRWHAPVLMAGHSCVRSWWRWVHGHEAPPEWDEYACRVRDGLLAVAMVVAPSTAMLADLEVDYGPFAQVRVIPNGRAFTPVPGVAREPIVFAAGRLWDEAKNIEAVCAVAPSLGWPVMIAGDDRHPDGGHCVPGYVHHLGPLSADAIAGWYARASIYVLPARYEPFGLTILEAALSGCALVLGDIRSLRENWTGAALFVPPDNRPGLAHAIQGLIRDPARREEMARRARARAQQFTVDRMVDGYLAAYRAIAAPVRDRRASERTRVAGR